MEDRKAMIMKAYKMDTDKLKPKGKKPVKKDAKQKKEGKRELIENDKEEDPQQNSGNDAEENLKVDENAKEEVQESNEENQNVDNPDNPDELQTPQGNKENLKSVKDMTPVEYYWSHKKEHDAKKLEEEAEKPKTKKKGSKHKVEEKVKKSHGPPPKQKEIFVGEQIVEVVEEPKKMYVIPVQEVNEVKKSKKTKGKKEKKKDSTGSAAAYDPGIKIIKNKESLSVKFPEYKDYRLPGREEKLEEKKKAEEDPKAKKAKKAPINVGSTRIT